ncbi:hypothetical protein LWI28_017761 [Acer negundo]|uniref:DUF7148 domain-containing protein n=1 Tax=Acer negundo TaxID=4023 RepID=A0AAD5I6J1_ACENE|nr:hypothetical protein LWI28_017761 [Acer negundo]KAK4834233.1 hypothetical protein QYF36_019376 [Acer negundo]
MMACAIRPAHPALTGSDLKMFSHGPIFSSTLFIFNINNKQSVTLTQSGLFSRRKLTTPVANKYSQQNDSIVSSSDDNEDGVSLGTMKLPSNTDIQRFDSLLFQWANSLCQGANLPLPMPLKVDKIPNGARLGFITIGDGETEVLVYIDCLVFPATSDSGPTFRAIRNGPLKDKPPPGEPRIMRSLLQALQKSVEIARV